MSDDAVPDLRGYEDTDVAVEVPALNTGAPWFVSEVAGLQFYAYGRCDDLTGERIMPHLGDRLHLVRDPENPHDANAVGVWWRNAHQVGHLPRYAAREVAPLLDAGAAARGYVYDEGDGEAWSLRLIVVGPAADPLYAAHIERVAYRCTLPPRNEKREKRLRRRAERFADQLQVRRERRVIQAVETLLTVPFVPELPDVGTEVDVDHVAGLFALDGRSPREEGQHRGGPLHLEVRVHLGLCRRDLRLVPGAPEQAGPRARPCPPHRL